MPPLPPDHRAIRIIEAVAEGAQDEGLEPLERAFFHFVKTAQAGMPEVAAATDLYRDEEYRHLFNALVLSGAHPESVAGGMSIDETTYDAYRHLFFDVAVFPHAPAKARFVKQLGCADDFRRFYELAIERGPQELLERYRIGARPRLDPESVVYDVMGDMWSKFVTHRGFAVTTDIAKEALRWGDGVLRTAKMLMDQSRDERKSAGAADDLRVALVIRDDTKTLPELSLTLGELVTGEPEPPLS